MRSSLASVLTLLAVLPASAQRPRRPVAPAGDGADIVTEARSSRLFRAEVDTSQLAQHGLATIQLRPGVELDFGRYLDGSRLRSRPELAPLFQPAVGQAFLERAPTQVERVLQLEDRLVVERKVQLSLKPGVCQSARLHEAVAALCFRAKPGALKGEVRSGLAAVRRKLAAAPKGRIVRGSISAEAALRMSDAQLLDLVLNQGEREITHVSVIPLEAQTLTLGAAVTDLPSGALTNFRTTLPQAGQRGGRATATVPRARTFTIDLSQPEELYDSLSPEGQWEFGTCMLEVKRGFERDGSRAADWGQEFDRLMVKGAVAGSFSYDEASTWAEAIPLMLRIRSGQRTCTQRAIAEGEARAAARRERMEARRFDFGERYFLTGDTVLRRIEDSFRVRFAPATWFTDEYYAKFSYYVDVSYGIRLGFGVHVRADPMVVQGSGARARRSRQVTIEARPINVDARGEPVYRAVGLPHDEYVGGKEFFFTVGAGCKIYASIPGKDIDPPWLRKGLPTVEGDFTPSLGSRPANMANVWLNGERTGLRIGGGIGGAFLDVGLAGDMTRGQILFRVKQDANTVLGGGGTQDLQVPPPRRRAGASEGQNVLQLSPRNIDMPVGLTIDNPRYAFKLAIVPQVRAQLELDLGIFEWHHTFGPFRFDGLAITQGFELDAHPGTRASQSFIM